MAALSAVQQTGIDKAREVSKKTLDLAQKTQDTLQKRSREVQKNSKHLFKAAQKQLASDLSKAKESLESSWSATQDMMEGGSMQIRKNLTQKRKDVEKNLQKRYKRYQRKRAWARRLFRWGVVSGFILALLFAPISGTETRKRITFLWNTYKQYLVQNQYKAFESSSSAIQDNMARSPEVATR